MAFTQAESSLLDFPQAGSSLTPYTECRLLRDIIPARAETAEVVPTPNTAEQSLILLNNALLLVSVDGWIVDVGRVAHPSAQGAGVPQSSLCVYLQKVTGLTD